MWRRSGKKGPYVHILICIRCYVVVALSKHKGMFSMKCSWTFGCNFDKRFGEQPGLTASLCNFPFREELAGFLCRSGCSNVEGMTFTPTVAGWRWMKYLLQSWNARWSEGWEIVFFWTAWRKPTLLQDRSIWTERQGYHPTDCVNFEGFNAWGVLVLLQPVTIWRSMFQPGTMCMLQYLCSIKNWRNKSVNCELYK